MSPKQKKDIRLRVLRLLLHQNSSVADLFDDIPDGEVKAYCRIVIDTMTDRLNFLLEVRNARLRAEKRKLAI